MAKRKPLSTLVWESLSEKIASGALKPGAQLPTEAELCAEYEVSRTVVREAIARLRSAGLVIPQQGRGMFVSEAPRQPAFQISEEALQTLAETYSPGEEPGHVLDQLGAAYAAVGRYDDAVEVKRGAIDDGGAAAGGFDRRVEHWVHVSFR